jgi:hypothetical protein
MQSNDRYFMCDQVKNQVPSLMQLGAAGRVQPRRSFTELAIFAAVTLGYLAVLSITA